MGIEDDDRHLELVSAYFDRHFEITVVGDDEGDVKSSPEPIGEELARKVHVGPLLLFNPDGPEAPIPVVSPRGWIHELAARPSLQEVAEVDLDIGKRGEGSQVFPLILPLPGVVDSVADLRREVLNGCKLLVRTHEAPAKGFQVEPAVRLGPECPVVEVEAIHIERDPIFGVLRGLQKLLK